MPEPGRSERIAFLRAIVARIEAGGAAAAMPARAISAAMAEDIRPPAPRPASFYEIAPASGGDCGAAAGFALSLAGQMAKLVRRPVLWAVEDFAPAEQGLPYAPGLAAYGLGLNDFILIRTANRLDLWRVMEEAVKARAFAAVIAEPSALSGRDLPALIRRLTLAARSHGAFALLLRPPSQAPFLAPSPLRFEVAARPGSGMAGDILARPLPGVPAWTVRYRGAPGRLEGFDPDTPFEAGLRSAAAADRIEERSRAALPVRLHRAA
ncbi:MAG: hypothetical protein AB7J19_15170 [Beijerinckiaceae bacterium]